MNADQPRSLRLKPFELKVPWTKTSPQEGEPDCLCAFCGKIIGVTEDNPWLEDHDPECAGCQLCDVAVRMWRGEGQAMEEIRFHTACLQLCVEAP